MPNPNINITALDHLVLTVADIDATVGFYVNVLGMQKVVFNHHRIALQFGHQKINLHQIGKEVKPNARHATCGSADLCLLTDTPLSQVMAHLSAQGVKVIDGIVPRTGAVGAIHSIYINDPDGNLIEISSYEHGSSSE